MMLRSAPRYAGGSSSGGFFSALASSARRGAPSAATVSLRRALGTNDGASSVRSRREPPAAAAVAAAKREAQPLTSAPHVQHQLKTPAPHTHDDGDDAQQQLLEQQPQEPQLSWRQRAKTFALEYGRVGVCTHIALSLVSFSAIYAGVSAGLDVSALLDTVGFSVTTTRESATNSAGSFVVAYAIYKLLSPVRWPLTFAVTPVVLRALRRRGYMLPASAVGAASTAARRSPPPPASPSSSS